MDISNVVNECKKHELEVKFENVGGDSIVIAITHIPTSHSYVRHILYTEYNRLVDNEWVFETILAEALDCFHLEDD